VSGLDDKVHFHAGGCSVIGNRPMLAADLVVDVQLMVNEGFQRGPLPQVVE
jgi:hypothetical protein